MVHYHPRHPARGCIGAPAPVRTLPWTPRSREPRNVRQRSSSPFQKAARWQSRSSLSKNRSPTLPDASAESRCTCAPGPASSAPPQSGILSASPARGTPDPVVAGYSQRSPSAVAWVRTQRGTCSPTWSGLGFDKHLTLILLTSWSSSHLRRIILPERSNLFKSHWSNQWLAHRVMLGLAEPGRGAAFCIDT